MSRFIWSPTKMRGGSSSTTASRPKRSRSPACRCTRNFTKSTEAGRADRPSGLRPRSGEIHGLCQCRVGRRRQYSEDFPRARSRRTRRSGDLSRGQERRAATEAESIAADAKFPVKVIGYSEEIEKLMQSANVMVSKLGGLTTFEALACRLPIIADATTPPMPQEAGTVQADREARCGNPTQTSDRYRPDNSKPIADNGTLFTYESRDGRPDDAEFDRSDNLARSMPCCHSRSRRPRPR